MIKSYFDPLQCGHHYHVFSRAVGDEKVFREEDNYDYFLRRMLHHLSPVVQFMGYSLMPNHFHLLIRVREEEAVIAHLENIKKRAFDPEQDDLSDFIMERFSNWLNGYVKAFNRRYERKGSLFMDYLRRNHAPDLHALTQFLYYIHRNAVHHGLEPRIGLWPFDSYRALLSNEATWIERDEVINWFGGQEAFRHFHYRKLRKDEGFGGKQPIRSSRPYRSTPKISTHAARR